MQTSVVTQWVPGKMPPPHYRETVHLSDGHEMQEWHDHVLRCIEGYPESTKLTVEDLSFDDLLAWVSTLTEKDLEWPRRTTRDLVQHLLGIPEDER